MPTKKVSCEPMIEPTAKSAIAIQPMSNKVSNIAVSKSGTHRFEKTNIYLSPFQLCSCWYFFSLAANSLSTLRLVRSQLSEASLASIQNTAKTVAKANMFQSILAQSLVRFGTLPKTRKTMKISTKKKTGGRIVVHQNSE